jgi:hypothetical protein
VLEQPARIQRAGLADRLQAPSGPAQRLGDRHARSGFVDRNRDEST